MSKALSTLQWFTPVYHPGDPDWHGKYTGVNHWSVESALDIDTRPHAVCSEPPPMNLMFQTQHIYNAKNTEAADWENEDSVLDEDERVIGIYSHSYAIEQTCCKASICTARCCTARNELTNTMKITTKRVEISSFTAS